MDPILTRAASHAAFTEEQRYKFLEVLGESGDSRKAARVAKGARIEWYALRDRDPAFAAAWQNAEEQATDALEGEAMRQALNGVEEQVFSHGKRLGRTRKRSEALLVLMLKARRAQRYGDRAKGEVSADLRAALDSIDGMTRNLGLDADDA